MARGAAWAVAPTAVNVVLPETFDGPAQKEFLAGTHRVCSPAATLERVRPHLSSMGITRIGNVTGLDRIGVPVAIAYRPNSRSLSTSQGKGLTLEAARVSAVMESIELHHAERILLPLFLTSAAELRQRARVADVEHMPSTPNSRYSEHLQMLWLQAHDLLTGEAVWLPFEVAHMSSTIPSVTGSGCFQSTSNGLASGNHLLEALAHALCEVIERDAVAVWQARTAEHRSRTELSLDTVDDPACLHILSLYLASGVSVRAWNATSDITVPTFICEIEEDGLVSPVRFNGMGAHTNRGVALLRALTEAAQSRLVYIAGARDDIFPEDYAKTTVPSALSTLSRGSDLATFQNCPPGQDFADFESEVSWLAGQLLAVGVPAIYVLNLSDQRFNIPVVRVVIPGLEGPDDDPSYSPGDRARIASGKKWA